MWKTVFVTKIIKVIEENFGEMIRVVTRGKKDVFLGMNINFHHQDGTATIKMKEYIKESISDFGQEITLSNAGLLRAIVRKPMSVGRGFCIGGRG